MCSGFWARDRDKSKLHLMIYSTNPRTSPHTSTKRREGINPLDNALKPQLYILNYSKIYILSNRTVTSTPGLLAQGVNPQDIRY